LFLFNFDGLSVTYTCLFSLDVMSYLMDHALKRFLTKD